MSKKSDLTFQSKFIEVGDILLPRFSGTRVMMMPITLGDLNSVPDELAHYLPTLKQMFDAHPKHHGQVGYLTIDEKTVKKGKTHRRAGKHVDGVYRGSCGSWGGSTGGGSWGGGSNPAPSGGGWGGGGGWGAHGTGMLTVSNIVGCKAWNQEFEGALGYEGEADHLADQCKEENATLFQPNRLYWVDGLCVHESLPMLEDCDRQFIRLSMPSTAPWFEGYTENPKGIKPTGPILPRRSFMDEAS